MFKQKHFREGKEEKQRMFNVPLSLEQQPTKQSQNLLYSSFIAPSPFHRANESQEDTVHRLQARGSLKLSE